MEFTKAVSNNDVVQSLNKGDIFINGIHSIYSNQKREKIKLLLLISKNPKIKIHNKYFVKIMLELLDKKKDIFLKMQDENFYNMLNFTCINAYSRSYKDLTNIQHYHTVSYNTLYSFVPMCNDQDTFLKQLTEMYTWENIINIVNFLYSMRLKIQYRMVDSIHNGSYGIYIGYPMFIGYCLKDDHEHQGKILKLLANILDILQLNNNILYKHYRNILIFIEKNLKLYTLYEKGKHRDLERAKKFTTIALECLTEITNHSNLDEKLEEFYNILKKSTEIDQIMNNIKEYKDNINITHLNRRISNNYTK